MFKQLRIRFEVSVSCVANFFSSKIVNNREEFQYFKNPHLTSAEREFTRDLIMFLRGV